MNSRNYYKVTFTNDSDRSRTEADVLDNDTEFNANQFKLYDDFTTDLRLNFDSVRNYCNLTRNDANIRRRAGDPNDSGVDMENGNQHDNPNASNDSDLLENEVMLDPWGSMDSSNSPLTDSGPSASEDCTPSTSSEPQRQQSDLASPLSPEARCLPTKPKTNHRNTTKPDKARSRDLTLELETLETGALPRRPHFLDEDYQPPSKSNIECRIPKPHFLDHSPSPDEFDERSDITNPNFLDDEVDAEDNQAQKKSGALPKKPTKSTSQEDRPHRTGYRSTLHYGLENAARSSERDKRASQLYRGTWPGERDGWTGHDSSSVRSFSSNGSTEGGRASSNLENKMECVCSLISLLSLSPENNADLSGPLLDMSRSVESCIAMRQAGCIPLLVQLIHSKVPRETRDRAAKALRNIIHTQTDDKAGRREARVWRLLEQVREYCYVLEDVVESRKEGKEAIEDDASKHPSQSVAALMKLSFDEEHRHVVCQLGGLQALAALVSGDQAAHGSRTDDNTCLTMRKYAGMTLTNLTFGDGNNKSLLCSFKDFMMALVEQLESPNDDMRQVTAAVLRNLSWRADTNSKQVLREVGAVKGLTKAAMTCQKEATLKSVLSALWNLTAHCSMNKVALCSVDGALGFLVDMLSYNSPTKTLAIVENAGGIMRNVSSHIAVREDYRQILRERNCLSVLLQHLKSPSLTVVSNSCGTLWNLSARCPLDQQFLWDHGAVPMLRSLIHSKHKMIAMGSGAALKNLLNSKPGKTHIISLDTTARTMNLPALPTLGARKQKALEQELDQNLAETCDNIEPATSPSTSNREEKNLFTATERHIAMNLERHRMTSSSPLMGTLTSQISLSHSAHLASYLSCSNTLLKGTLVSRSTAGGSANNVNRSDSKDSVTSTHSDTIFERVMRPGKVPVPTPRNKDLMKNDTGSEPFKAPSNPPSKDGPYPRYPTQPPIPPPRTTTELRNNYTESGFDVDQDSCDQPIDFSQKYSETKPSEPGAGAAIAKSKTDTEAGKKFSSKKDSASAFGDYQETDLDQPTDYSLRYAEHQSENGSDTSEPPAPSVNEDTIKHFATEGTPYETPIIFSTATSMSDLRVIGKDAKLKASNIKENPEVMTHSDEKDTCSIEDPPRHDNDRSATTPPTAPQSQPVPEKRSVFDTKFSSGMISPEKPVNYCDEGTPGYFSRVSSLSSLGEPTEEYNIAKRNAMATINTEPSLYEQNSSTAKDKEGSKAVTFATEPATTVPTEPSPRSGGTPSPHRREPCVEDTPLMFSRCSSLGSLPECDHQDDHGSVVSEVSRLTSGCVSPSEIPDSPGALGSAPLSPRGPPPPPLLPARRDDHATPPDECAGASVFEERPARFVVEDTPAQFSAATSLSSLTIDDEPRQPLVPGAPPPPRRDLPAARPPTDHNTRTNYRTREQTAPVSGAGVANEPLKGTQTPGDTCRVYFTEDTPAILSKAGSNSNLSVLSIESRPPGRRADRPPDCAAGTREAERCADRSMDRSSDRSVDRSSDSSNMSDAGDLLEEYIQKGIDKVVKNKGPPSDVSSVIPYTSRDGVYRSLPPYLRSSTETVRMSQDYYRNARDSRSRSRTPSPGEAPPPPPPPLPPKTRHAAAPPRPPPLPPPADAQLSEGRKHESRLPVKSHATQEKPKPLAAANLVRNDSLSSLSLDSFGSTDREIFEETVQAGLSRVNPRARLALHGKGKAHSAERPAGGARPSRHHRSLDRSDRITQHQPWAHELDYNQRSGGDTSGAAGRARRAERGPLERSNSLSSLSNDSFGSTDKEVFERCVKMGMAKAQPKKRDDGRPRGRSDDRSRRRRPEPPPPPPPPPQRGALERMVGEEYSRDRALLEEVIARGAGETNTGQQSKNVPAPSAGRAPAGGAPAAPASSGCEPPGDGGDARQSLEPDDASVMERSNECLAPRSANTTLESETRDELNRSNESYAEVLEDSFSDHDPPPDCEVATLEGQGGNRLQWTDIKCVERPPPDDLSKKSCDTWNDNTCPDDVTFPTISGSVHMVSSIRSEVIDGMALPDLLEKSKTTNISQSRPDLTDKLDDDLAAATQSARDNVHPIEVDDKALGGDAPDPKFTFMVDDGEPKYDSLMCSAIEKEAARLAAQLKCSQYTLEASVSSLISLDLDNIKPPSNLGSLLSLSTSGHWEDASATKKSPKNRKKSLPVSLMVKRALSNSMHQGSSEHLDSNPVSFLDNVKPPSEMENIDMESSMVSVCSIVSEVAEFREKTPVVFDFKQPVQDFPHCTAFNGVFHDLDKVNPPSLFDEMAESTIEVEPTTAQEVFDDCVSNTLNVITDLPSGSENCTPIPTDMSSVESTPKRQRTNYLTPKEKRLVAKDRYQTYTITDTVAENDEVLEVAAEGYLTWTKSESDRSDDYFTATSEPKTKRKVSAKQRRLEDRARYQTQTVDINNILIQEPPKPKETDSRIESLKQRLAAKKTMKQKRMEDAERFRTRTLSEDIPPSPTYVTRDANFENVETTTGYDSLSSNEPNHQQLADERPRDDDASSRGADSGHNEDDFELNTTQMKTYTKSFRNYLPVTESPAAVDMCVVNNLKNIEMTASYKRSLQMQSAKNSSSSDFASYEGDSNSEDRIHSDPDTGAPLTRPKPKIIKPEATRRDESLDSNESQESEQTSAKAVRGRKKAAYVSPYRRNIPAAKKTTAVPQFKTPKTPAPAKGATNAAKAHISAKIPNKTPTTSKVPSANTSPKKSIPNKSPSKVAQQRPASIPQVGKPLPLVRQGTFTKEESTVPARDLPVPDKKTTVPRLVKATSPTKAAVGSTSPSRLPQYNRNGRTPLRKISSNESKQSKISNIKRTPETSMRNSPSNHSLQSNESGKTITLASKGSRQGSTSSVNSIPSTSKTKDVESKIASLWKKVEQSKKLTSKPDKRVWIESDKVDPPKLIRSSTFEGQPKQCQSSSPKQKTAIGIKVSQIPSLRPKSTPGRVMNQASTSARKPANTRLIRKNISGQITS